MTTRVLLVDDVVELRAVGPDFTDNPRPAMPEAPPTGLAAEWS